MPEQAPEHPIQADPMTVALDFVTYPGVPHGDQAWVVETTETAWMQDWLVEQVEAVLDSGDPYKRHYVLQSRQNHVSWGAAGFSSEVVVQVFEGLASAALYAGLERFVQQLVARLRSQQTWLLDEGEAERTAQHAVSRRFAVDLAALTTTSTEVAANSTGRVVLQDGTHRFNVDLTVKGGAVCLLRIQRDLLHS